MSKKKKKEKEERNIHFTKLFILWDFSNNLIDIVSEILQVKQLTNYELSMTIDSLAQHQ